MTDKQIIIDDLMKQLNEKTAAIMLLRETLDRKEQECEKLEKARRLIETSRDKWEYIAKNKERECEELKTLKDETYFRLKEEYIQQLDQLKAQLLDQEAETLKAGGIIETLTKENEQLKKQVCGLRPELKCIIDKTCCKYNINAKYYHEKIVEIINNLDKLKQTLTEIKEICNNNDELKGDFNLVDCDKYKLGKHNLANRILQKISEVD